jgi:hypothetical protein
MKKLFGLTIIGAVVQTYLHVLSAERQAIAIAQAVERAHERANAQANERVVDLTERLADMASVRNVSAVGMERSFYAQTLEERLAHQQKNLQNPKKLSLSEDEEDRMFLETRTDMSMPEEAGMTADEVASFLPPKPEGERRQVFGVDVPVLFDIPENS